MQDELARSMDHMKVSGAAGKEKLSFVLSGFVCDKSWCTGSRFFLRENDCVLL